MNSPSVIDAPRRARNAARRWRVRVWVEFSHIATSDLPMKAKTTVRRLRTTRAERKLGPRHLLLTCSLAWLLGCATPAHAVYAIAQFGTPKYPPGFKHFDYVNPDAPKGG
ncbi:hypothetical protein FCO27_19535, partial [Bacillus pumilus]